MESVAKWASVIGGVGALVCFIASSHFLNATSSSHDDVDWNDWIVYEVEGGEATLFLDEDIGYTIYVEDSHSCSEVTATVYFEGEDYYDPNCDPFYDFDNWIQIGDIVNDYGGDHQVTVTSVDRFIVVDWTTVDGNNFEYMLMSSLGCCVFLIILVIGLVLTAFTEKKAPPTPQFVRDSSGQYRPIEEKPDGQGEEKPPESGGDWWN